MQTVTKTVLRDIFTAKFDHVILFKYLKKNSQKRFSEDINQVICVYMLSGKN